VLLVTAVCSKFRVAGFKGRLGATSMTAHLIVPGFNGGNPMKLLNFDCSPVMRAAGGGPLARDLDDHLEHPLEEGKHSTDVID
jgi:hypothetical protein